MLRYLALFETVPVALWRFASLRCGGGGALYSHVLLLKARAEKGAKTKAEKVFE